MAIRVTNITQRTLETLIESQGHRCALTGRVLTPETASLDHRVPVTRGGQHTMANTWVVHADVNRAKGTMTTEEFIAMCREVVRHHARKRHTRDNTPELPFAAPESGMEDHG